MDSPKNCDINTLLHVLYKFCVSGLRNKLIQLLSLVSTSLCCPRAMAIVTCLAVSLGKDAHAIYRDFTVVKI